MADLYENLVFPDSYGHPSHVQGSQIFGDRVGNLTSRHLDLLSTAGRTEPAISENWGWQKFGNGDADYQPCMVSYRGEAANANIIPSHTPGHVTLHPLFVPCHAKRYPT